MKLFLGMSIAGSSQNRQRNGEEFLLVKSPGAGLDNVLARQSSLLEATKEMTLPQWLRLGYPAAQLASIFGLGAISIVYSSIAQSYQRYWWLYWLTGICLGLWIVLANQKKNRTTAAQEYLDQLKKTGGGNTFSAELGVPSDVRWVDILCFPCENQRDAVLPKVHSGSSMSCFNVEHRAFVDTDTLYLVNEDGKFGFSRWQLSDIQIMKQKIILPVWNKKDAPDECIYRKYHLKRDHSGRIHCPAYGVLTLTHNSEKWGICFPAYELETLQQLTGMKVRE